MIKEAIIKLSKKEDLEFQEAYQVMQEIMAGKASNIQISAFLVALSLKGETVDEIAASAKAMREAAKKVDTKDFDCLEIVGTGGDGSNSFNISTTSSILVAAAGVKVTKHGNRAASSKSGTVDCQEALGINVNQNPDTALKLLEEVGICFLFAQKYHEAMKNVAEVRKELAIKTIFNIIGPLTNPANPKRFLLGVSDKKLLEPMAIALNNLGVRRALVVHGDDRLDEISISSTTSLYELKDGYYRSFKIAPEDFSLQRGLKEDLAGGNPEENANICKEILSGKIQGSKRNAVLLNSGAALYVAGVVDTLKAGVEEAAYLIDSGKAYKKMQEYIKASNEY